MKNETPEDSTVNHVPKYYLPTKDVISRMPEDMRIPFCIGNFIKYATRASISGEGGKTKEEGGGFANDIKKVVTYVNRCQREAESQGINIYDWLDKKYGQQ